MKLNNNIEIPSLGLGTYLISPEDAKISVCEALKIGYRLIDTANAYVNERAVGKGIKDSGIKREDIFVSTKLWPSEYENENAINETLERLDLDYIDLLFLHQPAGNWQQGYKMLEKAYEEGKIKAIGISNFEGKYIDELLNNMNIKHIPQVIQVECHPYYPQEELLKILTKYDIKLMSWYPLGHGDSNLLNEPIIKEIATKYQKTPSQIILRWHIEKGFIVIPGSKNINHIKENYEVLNFKLTEYDMNEITKLNNNKRYYERNEESLEHFAKWQPTYEEE